MQVFVGEGGICMFTEEQTVIKHLMSGPKANSEFCFSKTLKY